MPRSDQPKPLPAASLHLVLALLQGESHGYALLQRVAELSDGAVRMGPGTLYGTLNRLLLDGLIVETTDDQPREESERRRYYRLTVDGQQVATSELARLRNLVTQFRGLSHPLLSPLLSAWAATPPCSPFSELPLLPERSPYGCGSPSDQSACAPPKNASSSSKLAGQSGG